MKQYFTIYKITNQINGKIYIGAHKTNDLNDDYMDSGKCLRRSQKKHGIEHFSKEILFIFDTLEEMYAKEVEIVTEEFVAEDNTYNLTVGGRGGWDRVNLPMTKEQKVKRAKLASVKGIKALLEKIAENPDFLKGKGVGFKGKTHTIKTKEKMSKKAKDRLADPTKNSQYGTRWIFSLEEKRNKKIHNNDPLPNGWQEGRKMKF